MNKKLINTYAILSLTGIFIWLGSSTIREANLDFNPIITFLLGTGPNFGAGLCFPFFCLLLNSSLKEKQYPESKIFILGIIFMFIPLTIMEVIHPILGGSSFDIWDLVMSAIGGGFDFLIYKSISKKHLA